MKQEDGTPPPPGRGIHPSPHVPSLRRATFNEPFIGTPPEAGSSYDHPHILVSRRRRPLRRAVQGGLRTIHPVRTVPRLRSGLTSSATPYLHPHLIQGSFPLVPVDPPLCLVSVLLRAIQVKPVAEEIGWLVPHPTLRV